jgi:hypothetical protein
MFKTDTLERTDCIEHDPTNDDCKGSVELRESLSGTGTPIPRCDGHWEKRLDLQDELNQRYPVMPPSDWSPLVAGESWDEDY